MAPVRDRLCGDTPTVESEALVRYCVVGVCYIHHRVVVGDVFTIGLLWEIEILIELFFLLDILILLIGRVISLVDNEPPVRYFDLLGGDIVDRVALAEDEPRVALAGDEPRDRIAVVGNVDFLRWVAHLGDVNRVGDDDLARILALASDCDINHGAFLVGDMDIVGVVNLAWCVVLVGEIALVVHEALARLVVTLGDIVVVGETLHRYYVLLGYVDIIHWVAPPGYLDLVGNQDQDRVVALVVCRDIHHGVAPLGDIDLVGYGYIDRSVALAGYLYLVGDDGDVARYIFLHCSVSLLLGVFVFARRGVGRIEMIVSPSLQRPTQEIN